jgi:hypothetical protein
MKNIRTNGAATAAKTTTITKRVWLKPDQIEYVDRQSKRLGIAPPEYLKQLVLRDWEQVQAVREKWALPSPISFDRLKEMAGRYQRARARRYPLWRLGLSEKLCRKMRPLVKDFTRRFGITAPAARGMLLEIGFRSLCHESLPASPAKG